MRFLLLKNCTVGHCDCDIAVERQQSGAFLSSSVISVPTRAKRMISWERFLSLQRSTREHIILEGVLSVCERPQDGVAGFLRQVSTPQKVVKGSALLCGMRPLSSQVEWNVSISKQSCHWSKKNVCGSSRSLGVDHSKAIGSQGGRSVS